MKRFYTFLTLLISLNNFGQNLYLKINSLAENETVIIDSLAYQTKHSNADLVINEVNFFSEKLLKTGYLESKLTRNLKQNDSTFLYQYVLGVKTDFIHIYIGKENRVELEEKSDTIKVRFIESEGFLISVLKKLEKKGFSMAKVKLNPILKKGNHLKANLFIDLGNKRFVNDIVINGYDKFPEGFKKNIIKNQRNKTFTQESLEKVNSIFNQYRFVKQTKYPEILFTKDSTKVFVYLEKTKSNVFDGFIGFSNDENKKVVLNGYVDLTLNNALNSGEKLSLFWKSDGKDQKTFNLSVDLPYIFKSNFGLKTQLNIFKQDSTFQNTKTNIDLGYFFNFTSRLYLGYQSTESSDINNINTTSLNDFSNSYITANFDYFKIEDAANNLFFLEKSNLNLKIGTGQRDSKFNTNSQFFGNLNLSHNLYLNNKNSINIKSQNYYLQSNYYLTNELFRFGGINSIRGFNENSLQGNLFNSILSEYRYILAPSIYMHSIIDYGYFQDKTTNTQNNLLGIGFGFGLLTKNGIFNLIYANGSNGNEVIKLSNSIVHISFKANF